MTSYPMDMSSELANQAAAEAVAAAVAESTSAEQTDHDTPQPQPGQGPPPPPSYQRARSTLPFQFGPPHRQAPDSPLSNSQQLAILREFYARNPTPSKRDFEILAEKTGRPWTKIREYFRQRRNKMRGLSDLEGMEEPGRASSWLQVTYRPGPSTASVSQLALYNAYKTRFDPYSTTAPLLGGQELIQLACSTFPGCEMARDEGDYVLKGLRDKDSAAEQAEWDRGVDNLVEPLRSATWLLGNFQHQSDGTGQSITQTELYTAYATRFSSLNPESDDDVHNATENHETMHDHAEESQVDGNIATETHEQPQSQQNGGDHDEHDFGDMDDINAYLPTPPPPARLLNPVELISLTRMTFPKCEPAVDEDGRFVIRGLERRVPESSSRQDMFPFGLASQPSPSDPNHPFTNILKRKLALLDPEPTKPPSIVNLNNGKEELTDEDRELVEGLKRFKHSRLGQEVRDACVQQ